MASLRSTPSPRLAVDEYSVEAALVAQAKRDHQAFASLYRRYVGSVYAYCFHRLQDRESAEDATSRTFERALAGLSGCREEAFRGWLFAIAANVVADHYRVVRPSASLETATEYANTEPSLEELVLSEDAVDRLGDLIARLPENQRRVLELRVAGLKGDEIAVVLQRSHAAVRMLQLRAIKQLRLLMQASPGGGADHAKR